MKTRMRLVDQEIRVCRVSHVSPDSRTVTYIDPNRQEFYANFSPDPQFNIDRLDKIRGVGVNLDELPSKQFFVQFNERIRDDGGVYIDADGFACYTGFNS